LENRAEKGENKMNFIILERTNYAIFDEAGLRKLQEFSSFLDNIGVQTQLGKNLLTDLVALAAAEITLVNHPPVTDPFQLFPIRVPGSALDMSIMKTDTMPTLECETERRVLNGDLHLNDLFLFTADIDKLEKFYGSDITIKTFQVDFNNAMEAYLGRSTEMLPGSLSVQFATRLLLRTESAIWRLRLSVLNHPEQEGLNFEEFTAYCAHAELPIRIPEYR
jgi:hypothetical protein